MRKLFDPVEGIGVSVLRQPIGSSDLTVDPRALHVRRRRWPGANDYPLRAFTIAHDEAQILPLLREAKRLNPDLKIIGTPWSPPAWLKTNDSLIGGGSRRA